jgi:hypothetical protein
MSTIVDAGLAWFPLVPRPRPLGLPLEARVAELATLATSAEHGNLQEKATRAAEVLNKAALIASDCGIPALARELCHRQYELLAQSAPLPSWAVRLAMQPVLNIPRQLIRDGHGDNARAVLETLHAAALSRAAAVIDGMRIDFGTLTSTTDGRKEACTLTWTALLADGTRALAQAGRWKEAAEHAAAYRGTGARLLDGRQAAILALLADKQASRTLGARRPGSAARPVPARRRAGSRSQHRHDEHRHDRASPGTRPGHRRHPGENRADRTRPRGPQRHHAGDRHPRSADHRRERRRLRGQGPAGEPARELVPHQRATLAAPGPSPCLRPGSRSDSRPSSRPADELGRQG